MCGITGFTGKVKDGDRLVRKMADRITHRGPDSEGYYLDDGIAMGFRRLSIIDISERGDQPIFNEDKSLVITFNGEIYNYRELREELMQEGHSFSTCTDTETILHGFEQWGEDVLDHLRGMFSFAIWNIKTQELFLARDFFGIKPLHYTQAGDHFVYGSEISSILEFPGFEKKVDLKALDCYLSFEYVVPPRTMFEGIYSLLPGHCMKVKDGRIRIRRYWEPVFEPDESITEEEAVEEISRVFADSVQAHRIADVEVGCFLSGGIDSSFAASFFGGQKSFTVGFAYDKYNECEYSAELAKEVGLDHHQKLITPEEYWSTIRHVQYQLGQPSADASCIALYHVCRIASEKVKVVLSGEGADELFGGYNLYHEPDDLASFQRTVPLGVRRFLASAAGTVPVRFKGQDFLRRAALTTEERFIGNNSLIQMKMKRRLLKADIPVTKPQEYTAPIYARVPDADDLTKMQYLDLHVWMVGDILVKSDRMSMANSLELRVPFLDRKVWDTARRLPKRLRVNEKNTKYALRQAAERRLPEKTAQRKKLGFPVPTRIWLREEPYYTRVKEYFTSEDAAQFFNTDELLKLLEEHRNQKADHNRAIWTVLMFLCWYDIYFHNGPHALGDTF